MSDMLRVKGIADEVRDLAKTNEEILVELRAIRGTLRDILTHQTKVADHEVEFKDFMGRILNPKDPHAVDPQTGQYVDPELQPSKNPDVGPK